MKNVLVIAGSTSPVSINRQLAHYAASKIEHATVTELLIKDLNLPLYSEDEETENGIPEGAKAFIEAISKADSLVVSLAEHNGSYSAAFKNVYDWASRVQYQVWGNKPMLLMATSPGARGGATVLEAGKATFPRMGAELKASFSLPAFYDNFVDGSIASAQYENELSLAVKAFQA
jgi:chromate reductase, NAD(P)H dehydrogenase (quinone)